jgi:uncharacterized protein (DUF2384 family)
MAKANLHCTIGGHRQISAGKSIAKNPTSKAGAALRDAAAKRSNYVVAIQIADRASAVAAALGSEGATRVDARGVPVAATRWIDGSERPNSENARMIVDLDHVIARAGLLWKPSVIGSWLNGSNAFLDGARPIDVLRTTGSAPVIDALDQELAGGYA